MARILLTCFSDGEIGEAFILPVITVIPYFFALTLGAVGPPVLVGLATGLITSLLAGHVIQKLLYGVQVVDPSVILIVTSLFLVSAAAAAFLPARRAASIDPMDALRLE